MKLDYAPWLLVVLIASARTLVLMASPLAFPEERHFLEEEAEEEM